MFDLTHLTESLRNAHTKAIAILETLHDHHDPDWRWKAYLHSLSEDARQECYRAIDDAYDAARAGQREGKQ